MNRFLSSIRNACPSHVGTYKGATTQNCNKHQNRDAKLVLNQESYPQIAQNWLVKHIAESLAHMSYQWLT